MATYFPRENILRLYTAVVFIIAKFKIKSLKKLPPFYLVKHTFVVKLVPILDMFLYVVKNVTKRFYFITRMGNIDLVNRNCNRKVMTSITNSFIKMIFRPLFVL